jgi:hypothetical protein
MFSITEKVTFEREGKPNRGQNKIEWDISRLLPGPPPSATRKAVLAHQKGLNAKLAWHDARPDWMFLTRQQPRLDYSEKRFAPHESRYKHAPSLDFQKDCEWTHTNRLAYQKLTSDLVVRYGRFFG